MTQLKDSFDSVADDYDRYRDGYDSLLLADIKNIGPRGKAGTIMGAVFIQEFVDKAKWAHLDIAGTAWIDSARSHMSKGPTGVAIRSLIRLVERSQ
jgi:leucyl aminopeptidase